MAQLFALLTGFVPALFTSFLLLFGRKYTVATASILAYAATTITFIVCIKELLSLVLTMVTIPSFIVTSLSWLIPTNFVFIVSAILSGRICRYAYGIATDKIKLIASAT